VWKKRQVAEGSSAHSLFVAESRPQNPWVGLLAWKSRIEIRSRFTFPGQRAEWSIEAAFLHSQWRDRAGFAPVFPVMPSWAPKANASYHTAATASLASLAVAEEL
jgi:hypothetical protein